MTRHRIRLRRLIDRRHAREREFWEWALPRLTDAELDRLRAMMGQHRNPASVPADRLGGDDLLLWLRLEGLLVEFWRAGLWS